MANNEPSKPEPNSGIMLFLGLVFGLVCLIDAGLTLDQRLAMAPLGNGQLDFLIGLVMIIPGAIFLWWTNDVEGFGAGGALFAQMPGPRLISDGPYAYCRHPGELGGLLLFLGFAILFNSISSFVIVLVLWAAGLAFVKKKEKELEARFGQEYVEYRKRTPFLLPLGRGK